jgi:hypothetical protein
MAEKDKEWVSLGLMNEWRDEPEIYKNCIAAGHWKDGIAREHRNSPESIYLGCCGCSICRYTFSVDSSG